LVKSQKKTDLNLNKNGMKTAKKWEKNEKGEEKKFFSSPKTNVFWKKTKKSKNKQKNRKNRLKRKELIDPEKPHYP
jgi:hypothetical protein